MDPRGARRPARSDRARPGLRRGRGRGLVCQTGRPGHRLRSEFPLPSNSSSGWRSSTEPPSKPTWLMPISWDFGPSRSTSCTPATSCTTSISSRPRWTWILHALKPGGTLVSWDPLRHNPVINVYRRMAMPVRTEDEHPLHIRDLRSFRSRFVDVRHECFWFCTLAIFLRFLPRRARASGPGIGTGRRSSANTPVSPRSTTAWPAATGSSFAPSPSSAATAGTSPSRPANPPALRPTRGSAESDAADRTRTAPEPARSRLASGSSPSPGTAPGIPPGPSSPEVFQEQEVPGRAEAGPDAGSD